MQTHSPLFFCPDPDPYQSEKYDSDPNQNVTDPPNWREGRVHFTVVWYFFILSTVRYLRKITVTHLRECVLQQWRLFLSHKLGTPLFQPK